MKNTLQIRNSTTESLIFTIQADDRGILKEGSVIRKFRITAKKNSDVRDFRITATATTSIPNYPEIPDSCTQRFEPGEAKA